MPDADLTEKDWQEKVLYFAKLYRWSWFHPRYMEGSNAGWPDLAFWKPPQFFLAELKTESGRIRPDQTRVIEELRACRLEVRLWRPRDIDEVIARFAANVPV